jgi:hypothetical protein
MKPTDKYGNTGEHIRKKLTYFLDAAYTHVSLPGIWLHVTETHRAVTTGAPAHTLQLHACITPRNGDVFISYATVRFTTDHNTFFFAPVCCHIHRAQAIFKLCAVTSAVCTRAVTHYPRETKKWQGSRHQDTGQMSHVQTSLHVVTSTGGTHSYHGVLRVSPVAQSV